MDHPRRASRDPLKGAMPAGRGTRTRGILGGDHVAPEMLHSRCARFGDALEKPDAWGNYCRAMRTLAGGSCGWLLRQGLMSRPPRRV